MWVMAHLEPSEKCTKYDIRCEDKEHKSILVPRIYFCPRKLSPGGDGGVGPRLVVAQLHRSEEVLLGQGHVNLVLQCLVEDAGVREGRCLGPFSRPKCLSHLLPSTSSGIWCIFISLHVFINWFSHLRVFWSHHGSLKIVHCRIYLIGTKILGFDQPPRLL